jgi:hypothetical protein
MISSRDNNGKSRDITQILKNSSKTPVKIGKKEESLQKNDSNLTPNQSNSGVI